MKSGLHCSPVKVRQVYEAPGHEPTDEQSLSVQKQTAVVQGTGDWLEDVNSPDMDETKNEKKNERNLFPGSLPFP